MKILLTGDSIIARHEGKSQPYLNWQLAHYFPEANFDNTAVCGINSGAYSALLADLILKRDTANYLVILLGTNDLASHKQVPIAQFKQNMSYIASSLLFQYRPHQVILVSPPAVDEQKQHVRDNQTILRYSRAVQDVAKTYHFKYIALANKMLKQNDLVALCQGQKNDGLHFGKAGYELLAKLIADKIKEDAF